MTETLAAPPEAAAGGYRDLLGERDFLFLLGASFVSRSADFFSYVALAWVTLDLTHSGAAVALVIGAQTVTWVAVLLFGGALADRQTPRRLMARASLGRLLVTGVLAALIAAHAFNRWELLPAAILLGLAGGLFMPGRQSALPTVVPPRLLEAGNGLLQVSFQAATVAGPAIAGLIVARAGSASAFALDAAGYGAAALLVWLIASRDSAGAGRNKPGGSMLQQVGAGLRAAWNDVPLRAIVIVVAVLNFCGAGPLDVGLAVMARYSWGGAWALGLVLAGFGAGAVAGALAAGGLRRRPPIGLAIAAVCIWLAIGLAAFAFIGVIAAFADAVIGGLAIGFINVVGISWAQRRTPAEMTGRVMALISFASLALNPLSYAVAAPLVAISPPALFAGAGALLLLVGCGCLLSRRVRAAV